jgi:hypothetical protein
LKWSYSSSKGFYIGFKATVIIDFDSMNPICILIQSGAPKMQSFDKLWKLYKKTNNPKRRHFNFDNGCSCYKNYPI